MRQLVGLLLLVLWLPLTSHCTWENLPGLQFFQCATETPGPADADCDDDGCAQVESPTYKSSENLPTLLPPLLFVAFELPEPNDEASNGLALEPEFPVLRHWQFHFRTALPPRAPSFVS
jgi:hypothetical protein